MSKDEVLRVTNDEHASIMKILTTKTDQEIENSVETLKNWIFKQPHLPKNEGKSCRSYIIEQILEYFKKIN